ncbi:TFIIB-type zinc ribbon-containing protein [Nocardiopsis coralliicola]
MTCPKCQGFLQTVQRQGIHLEQCQGCQGIFLDRGELEQIIAAEKRHYGGGAPPYAPGGPHAAPHGGHGYADSPRGYRGGYSDSPRPYGGHGYSDSPRPYGQRRRKKSFLENLFD